MPQDKLTRNERIRLEAFAQINQRYMTKPLPLLLHIQEAEELEKWLKKADVFDN